MKKKARCIMQFKTFPKAGWRILVPASPGQGPVNQKLLKLQAESLSPRPYDCLLRISIVSLNDML